MELFPCYSVPLMKFLETKDIKYKLVALHPTTMKKMWVFTKDNLLDIALQEWKETKPIIR